MPTITIYDAQSIFFAYNQVVERDYPSLVLVHGAGGTHLHWPAELRTMKSTAVYTLDLPGHGKSDPPGRSSIDAYADDLFAFIDELGLEDVIVAGHSMGGAIAQMIGLRNPTWLRGLILLGTSARLPVTNLILDGLLSDFSHTVSFIMKMCWSGPYIQAIRIALAGREMRRIEPDVVHGDFLACNEFDVRNRLGEISVPTLVISGSDDKMTPNRFGQALAHQIANAQFKTIPQSGHLMALEYPLEVTRVMENFVVQLE